MRDTFTRELTHWLSLLTPAVFGASGDLAKKSTFPALYALLVQGLLPKSELDIELRT